MSVARLFHVAIPGVVHSRAFRCLWLLEEIGVEKFEVCMLRPGEPYARQMRDHGLRHAQKVPALQLDGKEITESGVISQVLAERYQSQRALLGEPSERTELLQWIAYAETCITFRIPLLPALMSGGKTSEELQAEVIEPMRQVFAANLRYFEESLSRREFLLASGFTVADTMCGWSLHTFDTWGIMKLDGEDSPRTLAYLERLRSRPAFRRAEQYAEAAPGVYGRGGVPLA